MWTNWSAVSIYMPTHLAEREARKDAIRLPGSTSATTASSRIATPRRAMTICWIAPR
jgi:hypothetical protein